MIITVAIIGILAAVAWPLYDQQSRKNRRTDSIAAIMAASQAMEQWFDDNGTYATVNLAAYRATVADTPPAACQARGYQIGNLQSCRGYYSIAISASTASTYTLTATAIGVQVDDDDCDTLSMDEQGQKTAVGMGTPTLTLAQRTARCWSE